MDDFQNIGIFLQLTAIITLLLKIIFTFDCTGISGRTQILHALVFTTRFLDLPYDFKVSPLTFAMKIIYLLIAYLTVALIYIVCRKTYKREYDTFRIDLLIGACTVMSLLSTYKSWDFLTIFWYFSIFLETFAIFPQIHFTARAKCVGSSLVFYVGLMACYRTFYIVHWTYVYVTTDRINNYYVTVGGIAQFFIYCCYFTWMIPIFKEQYRHLKNTDCQPEVLIVALQANGTDDNTRNNENLLNK